ncbi:MAG: hypothetical protein A2Z14_19930 [Chloroflexi bacterium RBG_16_48_8]|nr:MAG: hypothetical protein A2Z14_19930 [Chloroflexi bacterium RBG_16_48_8]
MTTDSSTVPQSLFVFVNLNDPVCYHNLSKTNCMISSGLIIASVDPAFLQHYLSGSADYLPFLPNAQRSLSSISLFCHEITYLYDLEYDAELARCHAFRLAPSRLSSLFAFGSMQDCQRAHQVYGWHLSTVRRFTLKADPLTRVARVNMEVVSLMRGLYHRTNLDSKDKHRIWTHYWGGGGDIQVEAPVFQNGVLERNLISSGVLWEYLVEGRLNLAEPLHQASP